MLGGGHCFLYSSGQTSFKWRLQYPHTSSVRLLQLRLCDVIVSFTGCSFQALASFTRPCFFLSVDTRISVAVKVTLQQHLDTLHRLLTECIYFYTF
jgi:hypothetical protein